jgi:hypothetical protein
MKVSRSIFKYKEKPHRETYTTYRRSSPAVPQHFGNSHCGSCGWWRRRNKLRRRERNVQAVK